MLVLPDLAAHEHGPRTPRRLAQLAWARLTGSDGLPVRVTLRDGRQFMATWEDEAPGEILVRPRWPDHAGRRPLIFLPRAEVAELATRTDRVGMQLLVVLACVLGVALLGAGLSAGRPVWPSGALPWIGSAGAGVLLALPVLFFAQRTRWLSRWRALKLEPDATPATPEAPAARRGTAS